MSYQIDDRRTIDARPIGYVVCTDGFLSGWGGVTRSLYALAVHEPRQREALEIAASGRSDMKRPRFVTSLRADGSPGIRLRDGDHLAIVDCGEASEWYRGAAARWMQ